MRHFTSAIFSFLIRNFEGMDFNISFINPLVERASYVYTVYFSVRFILILVAKVWIEPRTFLYIKVVGPDSLVVNVLYRQ
jgi:hypothetical protein